MANQNTITNYIKNSAKEAQPVLKKIHKLIKTVAPKAEETIGYGMPTFKLNGKNLVHFAAWKSHIGFYGTPSAHGEFKKELSKYKHAKGSVQFPLDHPIPYALIKKMVQFRVKEMKKKYDSNGRKK